MKKSIILSGEKASGKTYIAEAIALTHTPEKVLKLSKTLLLNKKSNDLLSSLSTQTYDLVIIEECKQDDIIEIEKKIALIVPSLSVVYITQDKIPYEFLGNTFYTIYCNTFKF